MDKVNQAGEGLPEEAKVCGTYSEQVVLDKCVDVSSGQRFPQTATKLGRMVFSLMATSGHRDRQGMQHLAGDRVGGLDV